MSKPKNLKIEKRKLILVEGVDAKFFMIWALQAIDCCKEEIQVLDFGGISDLVNFLQVLKLDDEFSNVTDLLIFRDAESNSIGAQDSVISALRSIGFDLREKKPFKIEKFSRARIGFGIFPGSSESPHNPSPSGTLEDLCLMMISNNALLEFVDRTITAAGEAGYNYTRTHKTKLYMYLALNDGSEGLKLGEAARIGIWDWKSKAFEPYIAIIQEICK